MVGVEFNEFQEFATRSLLKAAETKEYVALYSYELKRTIENDHQLKEYFFKLFLIAVGQIMGIW